MSDDRSATPCQANAAIRFSVIMNVYNGEAYLREAINSLLAQTFADWELIILDDGSTDGSAKICNSYSDPRIRYFLTAKHVSIAAARNAAIRHATGEWLAFLDQDDLWLPHKLAAQSDLINRDSSGRLGLVYGRTMRFDLRGRTSDFDPWHGPMRLPEGNISEELLRKPSFIALSSAVIRRTLFNEVGEFPPDIVYCPDYYLFVHVAARYQAGCVQELCCLYRLHAENMSRIYKKKIHEEALHIIEHAVKPSQRWILRRRRLVHQTWIGIEEIRGDREMWAGLMRILRRGSLSYLVLRPLALLYRRIRNRVMLQS